MASLLGLGSFRLCLDRGEIDRAATLRHDIEGQQDRGADQQTERDTADAWSTLLRDRDDGRDDVPSR
jgi:hypothetical protein